MVDQRLSKIGNDIKAHKLDGLIQYLKNDSNIPQKTAIYFVNCLCHACNASMNNPSQLDDGHVIKSLKKLVKYIKNTNEEQFNTYLSSVHYICRFLLVKDFRLILEIEPEIIPTFNHEALTEVQRNTYKSLCSRIQSSIGDMVKSNRQIEKEDFLSIYKLTSKILIESDSLHEIINSSWNYHVFMDTLKFNSLIHYKCFKSIPEHVRTYLREESDDNTLRKYLKMGILMYSYLMRDGLIDKCHDCAQHFLQVIPCKKEWTLLGKSLKLSCSILNKHKDEQLVELKKCRDALIRSNNEYEKSENLKFVCVSLKSVLQEFTHFCGNIDHGMDYISCESYKVLNEIVHEILACLTMNFTSCKGSCRCSSIRDVPASSLLVQTLVVLSYNMLQKKHNNEIIEQLNIEQLLKCLEKYSRFLVSLKNNNCEKWGKWEEFATSIYNIGVQFLRMKDYEQCSSACEFILKFHATLKKDDSLLRNTLNLYSSALMKLEKYKESLLFMALELINSQYEERKNVLKKIIKTKVEARKSKASEDIQEFTIGSINEEKVSDKYKCYMGDIACNKNKLIELIVAELEAYHERWRSKVPMMLSFSKLVKMADDLTLMKVFVKVFGDWNSDVHEKTSHMLLSLFTRFESSILAKKYKIFNVYLNAFRYTTQKKELLAKVVKKHESIAQAAPRVPENLPSEPDEKCDIVLLPKGSGHTECKTEYLVTSLKILKEIVAENISKHLIEVNAEQVYDLSKKMAWEFSLLSEFYYSLEAMILSLKLAEYSGNQKAVLETIGNMWKMIHDQDVEKEVEKQISKIIHEEQYNELLMDYYINLANCYLLMGNFRRALEYFNHAQENLLRRCNNESYSYISFQLLKFKLMQVSRSTNETNFILEYSYKPIFEAFKLISSKYYSDGDFGSQRVALLMDIVDILIKIFHDLKLPRFVRHYGRFGLSLSEHHILPVKRAKFLIYLAYADFRNCSHDDCKAKLSEISGNLLLESEKNIEFPHKKKEALTSSVDGLTDRVRDLAVNDDSFGAISSTISHLQTEVNGLPSFCYHEHCKCFQCTSFEYQILVMGYYHLTALCSASDKQTTISNYNFREALKFSEHLLNNKRTLSKILDKNLLPLWHFSDVKTKKLQLLISESSLNELKIRCSIDHLKFLYCSGARELFRKNCNNLWLELHRNKDLFPNLYSEVLFLKLSCPKEKNLDKEIVFANPTTCFNEKTSSPKKRMDLIQTANRVENTESVEENSVKYSEEYKNSFKTPRKAARKPPGKTSSPKKRIDSIQTANHVEEAESVEENSVKYSEEYKNSFKTPRRAARIPPGKTSSPKKRINSIQTANHEENTESLEKNSVKCSEEYKNVFKTPKSAARIPPSLRPKNTPLFKTPSSKRGPKKDELVTSLLMMDDIAPKKTPLTANSLNKNVPSQIDEQQSLEVDKQEILIKENSINARTQLLTSMIKNQVSKEKSPEKQECGSNHLPRTVRTNRRKLYNPKKKES